MKQLNKIAIVGANLAGARVAESLRTRGFSGSITMIGSESYLPYERPPLSKQVLMDGAVTIERLVIRSPQQWSEFEVDIRTSETVVGIDRRGSALLTASGGSYVDLDAVVLCTGGRSRILDVPGTGLAGVQYLRDLDDAASLAVFLQGRGRLVVVGGGYIGLEVAASAASLGCDVTVIETLPRVLARNVDPRWSEVIVDEHRRHGVKIHTDRSVRRFIGADRVRAVELDDETVLEADVVVIGVGMEPATELADCASLETAGGIVVNRGGATNNPHIFAAGDVTVQPDSWGGSGLRRFESFQNAQVQADCVAATLLGQPMSRRTVPWFWSDQYELNLQVAGTTELASEVVVRGNPEEHSFVAFYLRGDRLGGVLGINRGREVRAAMRLIDSGAPVDARSLADSSVDLQRVSSRKGSTAGQSTTD